MFSIVKRKLLAVVLAGAMLLGSAGAASADIRDFTFVNSSGCTIDQLYVSASEIASWEEDVLGKDVLGPAEEWVITFGSYVEGSCNYDVKVVFSDHDELMALGFDLCVTSVIELGADDIFYYR